MKFSPILSLSFVLAIVASAVDSGLFDFDSLPPEGCDELQDKRKDVSRMFNRTDLSLEDWFDELHNRLIAVDVQLELVDSQCKEETDLGKSIVIVSAMLDAVESETPVSKPELRGNWTKAEVNMIDFHTRYTRARSEREDEKTVTSERSDTEASNNDEGRRSAVNQEAQMPPLPAGNVTDTTLNRQEAQTPPPAGNVTDAMLNYQEAQTLLLPAGDATDATLNPGTEEGNNGANITEINNVGLQGTVFAVGERIKSTMWNCWNYLSTVFGTRDEVTSGEEEGSSTTRFLQFLEK